MLSCEMLPVTTLDKANKQAMYTLLEQHYAATSTARFTADLQSKDWVLLLRDEAQHIRGFSTLQVQSLTHEGIACSVLFSGDTVVDRAYWGEQELAFNWIRLAGDLAAKNPEIRQYWLLISKGHRTYRYLPAFAKHFIPHWSQTATAFEASLLHRLASERFGTSYLPEQGIIHFQESQGHLREDLAEVSARDKRLVAVNFFLQRNPHYAQGDELCCLCELSADNLRPLARRLFSQGLTPSQNGTEPKIQGQDESWQT